VTAAEQLLALAAEYWEFRLREYPTVAHDVGDARYRRLLFRESIADHDRRAAEASGFLARLARVPLEAIEGRDRHSHRLLARELDSLVTHHRFASHLRPLMFPESPDVSIAFALQRTAIRDRADAEDYLARLATLPRYLEQRRERLLAGAAVGHRLPRVLLPRVCASVEAHLGAPDEHSAWHRPFALLPPDDERFAAARARLPRLIADELRPAYARWRDLLRGDYAAHCRDSIGLRDEPEGEAYYAFLARDYTTTADTPAEIHATGLAEVARIRAAMESVADRAGFAGDLAGLRRHLAEDPRFYAKTKEELRERLEVLAKRIERRIPEFFGRIPRMTYGIESIPEAQSAQLPAAYAQPNPPSRLSAGVFWVTGLPDRCPAQMHVPLTLHEAWPGHLMHIALLQEMDDLPAFRRYGMMGYTAYIEGWALYCEQLGHDFGLYEDPIAHYGQLEMEMWRAVRLVVDTGIHVLGWSRDAAIAYMTEHLTLPGPTIEAEVDRYIGMPAQALAYKVGELKIRGLRERAARTLGSRFDLRALHDALSEVGPVTLELLEEHVQAWIDGQQARAA
jgi:uncharacterized protein (DUF885 family)